LKKRQHDADGADHQAQGGKAQTDQCQVHCGCRGCGGHEENVQPTPALHASQGQ